MILKLFSNCANFIKLLKKYNTEHLLSLYNNNILEKCQITFLVLFVTLSFSIRKLIV